MKKFILQILGLSLIIYYVLPYFVKGISVDAGKAAIIAALTFAFINFAIKPVLQIVTLPFNILSFGIFGIFINVLLFWFVASVIPGFTVTNFLAAFLGALTMTLATWLLNMLLD